MQCMTLALRCPAECCSEDSLTPIVLLSLGAVRVCGGKGAEMEGLSSDIIEGFSPGFTFWQEFLLFLLNLMQVLVWIKLSSHPVKGF